jgi:protein gp37
VMRKELDRLKMAQRPRLVFIGSMSDPFNDGSWMFFDGTGECKGKKVCSDVWIQDVIAYFCESLPKHRFILLTKKLENIKRKKWPPNVWIGTSVCDDGSASIRIPMLLNDTEIQCGGTVISAEPLQGGPDYNKAVDTKWLDESPPPGWLIIGSQTRPALELDQRARMVSRVLQRTT